MEGYTKQLLRINLSYREFKTEIISEDRYRKVLAEFYFRSKFEGRKLWDIESH